MKDMKIKLLVLYVHYYLLVVQQKTTNQTSGTTKGLIMLTVTMIENL